TPTNTPKCGDSVIQPPEVCDPPDSNSGACQALGLNSFCSSDCRSCFFCFTGDTLVATADGLRRIDSLHVGDRVWAMDVDSGQVRLQPVEKTMQHRTTALRRIDAGSETIWTTDVHPFFVEQAGWTPAGRLAAGDQLWTMNGGRVGVLASRSVDTNLASRGV